MKLHLKATAAMLALAAWPVAAQPAPGNPGDDAVTGTEPETGCQGESGIYDQKRNQRRH